MSLVNIITLPFSQLRAERPMLAESGSSATTILESWLQAGIFAVTAGLPILLAARGMLLGL
jgi:hypothetical protein